MILLVSLLFLGGLNVLPLSIVHSDDQTSDTAASGNTAFVEDVILADGSSAVNEQEPELTEDQKHLKQSYEYLNDKDYEASLRELDAALEIVPESLLYKVQRQFVELEISASAVGEDNAKYQKIIADWLKGVEVPSAKAPAITTPEDYNAFINSAPVTVVDFTAVWCGPCQMLAPYLTKIEASYAPLGVKFVRVDVDQIGTKENEDFVKENQLGPIPDVRIYMGGQLAAQVRGLDPFTILFDLDYFVRAAGMY